MAQTISLSTLLLLAVLGLVAYAVWKFVHYFLLAPRAFQTFWKGQGVGGKEYVFPLGQLPDIQRADKEERIVEYAVGMSQEYGLIQTQIVGCLCQVICYDPEMARAIFTTKAAHYHKASDWQKDIMRPLLHNGLLLSEDAYWKQQRTLLSPGFHFWYLQEMVPIIAGCIEDWAGHVEELLAAKGKDAEAGVELEMSHELATMTLDSVATAAFGQGFRADPKRADLFIHSLKQVLDNMQARTLNLLGFIPLLRSLPFPSLKAIKEGCSNIDSIVAEIVRDRKEGRSSVVAGGSHAGSELLAQENHGEQERRRDLLDLLLDAQKNMPAGQVLTDRGVEEESINFIAAGAETTSNLCIWMLHRIVTEPASTPGGKTILQKVKDEIDDVCQGRSPGIEELKSLHYLEAVAYEALRLHPPAPTIPKYAIEAHDIPLSGNRTIHVPQGTTVLFNANVMHRLPQYWPEPEAFRPERFLAGGDMDQTEGAGTAAGATSPTASASASKLTPEEKARKAAAPFAYLGFSAGPRKCIGKNLAMIEIKVIFTLLFQRFDLRLVPGQTIVANTITRLPKHGIKFVLTRRKDRIEIDGAQPQQAAGAADGTAKQRATVVKPLGMI